jgi:hypothetical protein
MFGDLNRKADVAQRLRWELWYEALMDLCDKRNNNNHASGSNDGDDDNNNNMEEEKEREEEDINGNTTTTTQQQHTIKVCILEIGCGMNVPTCRITSEQLLSNINNKQQKQQQQQQQQQQRWWLVGHFDSCQPRFSIGGS